MIHSYTERSSLASACCTSLSLSPIPCLVNQTPEGDRSCRFPTSQWGANIHPKAWHIAVTRDDIMTTWKLINSFIQPKLLLLFISVAILPPPHHTHLSLLLSVTNSSSCTSPPPCHVATVTHKSHLLFNAIHFP